MIGNNGLCELAETQEIFSFSVNLPMRQLHQGLEVFDSVVAPLAHNFGCIDEIQVFEFDRS